MASSVFSIHSKLFFPAVSSCGRVLAPGAGQRATWAAAAHWVKWISNSGGRCNPMTPFIFDHSNAWAGRNPPQPDSGETPAARPHKNRLTRFACPVYMEKSLQTRVRRRIQVGQHGSPPNVQYKRSSPHPQKYGQSTNSNSLLCGCPLAGLERITLC